MIAKVRYCVRCFTKKRASVIGKFSYEEHHYEVPVCDTHADMFDRDMQIWTRLAEEVQPKKAVGSTPTTWVPFPVSNGGVEDLGDERPAGPVKGEISLEAMTYTFTPHAEMRMATRKLTRQDIYRVISSQDKTTRAGNSLDTLVHRLGDVHVVVNPHQKSVITVAWKDEPEDVLV